MDMQVLFYKLLSNNSENHIVKLNQSDSVMNVRVQELSMQQYIANILDYYFFSVPAIFSFIQSIIELVFF